MLVGDVPTGTVPVTVAVAASMRVTVFEVTLDTQMLAPSNTTPNGLSPTLIGAPTTVPVATLTRVTLLDPELATHICVPSKARHVGPLPTGIDAPNSVFVAGSIRVTELEAPFVTQTSEPSDAAHRGDDPTVTVAGFARSRSHRCWVSWESLSRAEVMYPEMSAIRFTGPPEAKNRSCPTPSSPVSTRFDTGA